MSCLCVDNTYFTIAYTSISEMIIQHCVHQYVDFTKLGIMISYRDLGN